MRKTAVLWIGSSQAALLFSNFLLLKLLTNRIRVEDFGYYSLCMSVVLFARQIIFDSFSMILAKQCAEQTDDPASLSRGFFILKYAGDRIGVFLFLSALIVVAVVSVLGDSYSFEVAIVFSVIYLLANGFQGVYFNILNSVGRRKTASILSIADSILKISFAFIFINQLGANFNIAISSVALGSLVSYLGSRYFIERRYKNESLSSENVKDMARKVFFVSLPLYVPILLVALKSVGDRWLLTMSIGLEDLAAYSVLMQIGYFPVMLLVGVAQTYIAPYVYSMCSAGRNTKYIDLKKFIRNVIIALLVSIIVFVVMAFIFSELVFDLIVGSDYHAQAIYLPFFVLAGFLAAASGIFQLVAFGVFETVNSAKLMTISVSLSLVIVYILIDTFQFLGAVASLILTGLLPALGFLLSILYKIK